MLARGWSPSGRTRRRLSLLVGLSLVLNPFLLNAAGIGAPTYEYRVQAVEFTDGEKGVEFPEHRPTDIEGIACYPPVTDTSRVCGLERPLTDGRRVRTSLSGILVEGNDPYAHVNGSFYERTRNESAEGTTFGLRRVDARTAFRGVARVDGGGIEVREPVLAATKRIAGSDRSVARTTVEDVTRAERTDFETGTAYVVKTNGGYYVVEPVKVNDDGVWRDPDSILRGAVSFFGVFLGVWLLGRQYWG